MSEYIKGNFSCGTDDRLPLIKSDAMTFPHGFSTRLGGVSRGDGRDTLDLGAGDGDDVFENRKRFASALGSEVGAMFSAKQIHSDRVLAVKGGDLGQYFECDGFVTAERGLLLTVKVADCVPILLEDAEAGVIAAVHAGWRGTASGIALRAVEKMAELGADPKGITALIGPSIHSCCYEVDDPFVSAVEKMGYGELLMPYILPSEREGHYFADLQGMNAKLLGAAGVTSVHVCPMCTCCERELLFSHRGSGGKRGLMMAGIIMP